MNKYLIKKKEKWDRRFLDLAKLVSTWSKDPSTKVGAVIIRPSDKTICSLGYNGFSKKTPDKKRDLDNREIRLSRTIHAEINAILHSRERLDGYTLYTWPFLSCDRCSTHIIQCGIQRCVAPIPTPEIQERWGKSLEQSRQYFKEAGVQVLELNHE